MASTYEKARKKYLSKLGTAFLRDAKACKPTRNFLKDKPKTVERQQELNARQPHSERWFREGWAGLPINETGFISQNYPTIRYNLDFALPRYRIAFEIDDPSHNAPAQQAHDAVRTNLLTEEGWHVIRVKAWDAAARAKAVAMLHYLHYDFRALVPHKLRKARSYYGPRAVAILLDYYGTAASELSWAQPNKKKRKVNRKVARRVRKDLLDASKAAQALDYSDQSA